MRLKLGAAAAAIAAALFAVPAVAQPAVYDLVIRNGRVLDGAGNPWVSADVAISGGRIARMGRVPGRGRREIDARGLYVTPGFIDMMDQSQAVFRKSGSAQNKLLQGVTTVIAGEDGTPVPADKIPAYFAELERKGLAVNFGVYYSAQQARAVVLQDREGAPTPAQLERERAEVAKAMRAGAFGLSTALIYPPMSFQGTDELVALAQESGRCGGYYATHMRDEAGGLVGAVREAIEIGQRSGAKVEIFHLKGGYAPGWGKLMPTALAEVNAARARGVDVAADLYPYTAGGTGLSITAPNWVFADGEAKGYERLRDPEVRVRLKREIAAGSQPGWSNLIEASGGWDHVVLANAFNQAYDRYRYKTIAEIAASLGKDPADVAWDIVLAALPNRAMALYFMMNERDIQSALAQPWTSIGSDAGAAEALGQMDGLGLPHPRAYGTFPRVIAEYVKRRRVLTLEDAVRKMTSWPAARMGLTDRGVLREGLKADVVVFDLDRLDDVATWDHPMALPTGVEYVLVNGRVALEHGVFTEARSGQVLRHACVS
jgi:N-acyl-D-amino-acid deacylase